MLPEQECIVQRIPSVSDAVDLQGYGGARQPHAAGLQRSECLGKAHMEEAMDRPLQEPIPTHWGLNGPHVPQTERERDRVHGEDPGGTWSRSEFRLKACAEGDTASVASAPWEYGNRNAVKSPAGTKAQKLKILAGLEPNSYAECSDFYINVTRSPTLPNAVACPCSASCHLKISIAASRGSLHVGGTHTIS